MQLCSCGNCHDAAERAAQFVCKNIDDDECAAFTFAVCAAMGAIGNVIAHSLVQQYTESDGLVGALATLAKQHEIDEEMSRLISTGSYIDLINKALDRMHERAKEEANLPKGD